MNKWPKKWIDAARPTKGVAPYSGSRFIELEYYTPEEILAKLNDVGALKDPPQPREIWWCPECCEVYAYPNGAERFSEHDDKPCVGKSILMREVIDES